jgi:hypothetical protein
MARYLVKQKKNFTFNFTFTLQNTKNINMKTYE